MRAKLGFSINVTVNQIFWLLTKRFLWEIKHLLKNVLDKIYEFKEAKKLFSLSAIISVKSENSVQKLLGLKVAN